MWATTPKCLLAHRLNNFLSLWILKVRRHLEAGRVHYPSDPPESCRPGLLVPTSVRARVSFPHHSVSLCLYLAFLRVLSSLKFHFQFQFQFPGMATSTCSFCRGAVSSRRGFGIHHVQLSAFLTSCFVASDLASFQNQRLALRHHCEILQLVRYCAEVFPAMRSTVSRMHCLQPSPWWIYTDLE